MNSIIENAKRQSLTKLAGFGFVKQIASALVVAVCCLSAVAEAEDITEDRTLTQNTTIENISVGITSNVGISGNQKKITIQGSAVTLTLNNTEDSHFAGIIAGTGNVVKTGTGTLYLTYEFPRQTYSANLRYLGTTKVSKGTLNLDAMQGMLATSSQVIIEGEGVIETNKDQWFSNLSGTGLIKVTSPAMLNLVNSSESTYGGKIEGYAELEVRGGKTLTLSGSISDVRNIIVYSDGQLKLTGSALNYNGPMTTDPHASIDYNVKRGVVRYDMTETSNNHIDVGGVMKKTGDGTLQICCEAAGAVKAESVFISSGRMDYQGYFESYAGPGSGTDLADGFVVENNAKFSPGIGIGNATFVESNLTIRDNAIALFEFGAYNEDPTQLSFDTITIATEGCGLVALENSIQLKFLSNDAWKWAKEGAEYRIIIAEEKTFEDASIDKNFSYLLGNYQDYFRLEGRSNDGYYLIGLGASEPLPEPSTWALLILGVAGLMCVRKLGKK